MQSVSDPSEISIEPEPPLIRLTPLRMDHAVVLARWQRDAHLRAAFDGPDWSSPALCRGWISTQANGSLQDYLVQRQDGTPCGITTLRQMQSQNGALLSYAVTQPARRQGLGAAAVRATVCEACMRFSLRWLRAVVAQGNAPSVGVLRQLGFALVETFDAPDLGGEFSIFEIELDDWKRRLGHAN